MSEIFYTVLSGVLIYVIGQLLVKLLIEPYRNIFQAIEEAIFVAFAYDTVVPSFLDVTDPKDREIQLEAKKEFLIKGSRLVASVNSFYAYSFIELFINFPIKNIPTKNDLLIAGQSLLAMGNLIGNAHGGDELNDLSTYKYLLANKLGVKIANWENVNFKKIEEYLQTL